MSGSKTLGLQPSDHVQKNEEDEESEETICKRKSAKYLCGGEVVIGVEQLTTPTTLDSLCGTYRWVYMIPGEKYDYPSEIIGKDADGYVTLFIRKGKKPKRQHFSGKLDFLDEKAKFTGVRRVKDRGNNVLVNYWEVKQMDWACYDADVNLKKRNCFSVLKVCDDKGNPFIKFEFASTGRCGFLEYVEAVGKKQTDGNAYKGLTDAERKRLGMGLDDAELEALASREKLQKQEDKGEVLGEDGGAEDDEGTTITATATSSKRKAEDESPAEGTAAQKHIKRA